MYVAFLFLKSSVCCFFLFFKWAKSDTAGVKPRPRLCFHDKKDLAAVAVQEIPAFGCLLPFSEWKADYF